MGLLDLQFRVSRYQLSKLLEVLFVRELVSRLHDANSPEPPVTIDVVNPGLCLSSLFIPESLVGRIITSIAFGIIARSTEVGSRTLVLGASAGPGSHGEFMSDGQNQDVEAWIYKDVGKRVQRKVFEQTMKILETRKPGIGEAVGL